MKLLIVKLLAWVFTVLDGISLIGVFGLTVASATTGSESLTIWTGVAAILLLVFFLLAAHFSVKYIELIWEGARGGKE